MGDVGGGGASCLRHVKSTAGVGDHNRAAQNALEEDDRQTTHKPVGDWISVPSPNFVAMATRVGLTTFCMVLLNRPSPSW